MVRFLRPIMAGVVVAVFAAACTGGTGGPSVASLVDPAASSASSASPSASASLSPQDAALAYARCMRENGVDMPDPKVTTSGNGDVMIDQSGGAPIPKDKMDKADAVCRKFQSAAGPNGTGAKMSAEDMDKLLQFAKCMRAHGLDFPDPNADGAFVQIQADNGSSSGSVGTAGSPDDPKFQAAQTACSALLPGKVIEGDGGTTTSGGPGPAPSATESK